MSSPIRCSRLPVGRSRVRYVGQVHGRDNLAWYDSDGVLLGSTGEPRCELDQPRGEPVLLLDRRGLGHDPHGQWRSSTVDPCQLCQQLAVFVDHGCGSRLVKVRAVASAVTGGSQGRDSEGGVTQRG